MSILEEFLEKISALPIDFNRNLRLVQDLDMKAQKLGSEIESLYNNYLNLIKSTKDKKGEAKKHEKALEPIHEKQIELNSISTEKVHIVEQLEEMIIEYIQKLDEDIKVGEEYVNKHQEEIEIKDELKIETSSPFSKKKKKDYSSKLGKRSSKGTGTYKAAEKQPVQTLDSTETTMKLEEINDSTMENPDKKYCYSPPGQCKKARGAFGDMVACDNFTCPNEWFHLECMGMDAFPKGKWFCKNCQRVPQTKKKDSQKNNK